MKSGIKKTKNWHEPKSPKGSGDGYGSGIKQPIGRIRDVFPVDGQPKPPGNKGKAPKSFA